MSQLKAAFLKPVRSLRERVEEVIARYQELDDAAEVLINEFCHEVRARDCPSLPLGAIRQCEIDARARSYSYEQALRVLLRRLS
jgi:hypothetical protein